MIHETTAFSFTDQQETSKHPTLFKVIFEKPPNVLKGIYYCTILINCKKQISFFTEEMPTIENAIHFIKNLIK